MTCSRALPRLALAAAVGLAPPVARAQELTPREIAAAARQATVQIRALDARGRVDGLGSGFFVSADGTIVTNFHVIEDAHTLQVETFDGEVYDDVHYVTSDPRRDVAVLKVPVEGAVSLRLGSDSTVMGAEVYAMGHPLGQTGTFSDGLVSAHRTIEGVSMIQISAPISTGSSGGPVMDARGEVIGVATMVLTGGQNLNYAVPVRYVRPLLDAGDRPRPFARSQLPRASGGLASVGERPAPGPRSSRPGGRVPPGSTRARERWEEQVIGFLELGEEMLEEGGFVRTHEYETGTLRQGASETVRIKLDAGVTYMLTGACDTDCDDVDLRIFGPRGTLLDSDLAADDFPVLSVTPRTTGEYTVRVTMASCDTSVCYYSLGVYGSR